MIHHLQFEVYTLLLERLPDKILYHIGGAACSSSVTFEESGCSALYVFQLHDASGSVWIPCCSGILEDRSDQDCVKQCALTSGGQLAKFLRRRLNCYLPCSYSYPHVTSMRNPFDVMTHKSFPVLVIDRSWPCFWYVVSTGFLLLVTLNTSLLLRLNDICQFLSHCKSLSKFLRSAVLPSVLDTGGCHQQAGV